MNKIFEKYNELASLSGINTRGSKESLEWFRERIRKDSRIRDFDLITKNLERAELELGEMITFKYKPIGEKTLKYYDTQPLVILTELHAEGWVGVNVHYLPPVLRSKMFHEANYSKKRFFAMAYELQKSPYTKPAFKRYKADRLQSKPFTIPREEWEIAIQLPYEDFMKASIKTVWTDSRNKIR